MTINSFQRPVLLVLLLGTGSSLAALQKPAPGPTRTLAPIRPTQPPATSESRPSAAQWFDMFAGARSMLGPSMTSPELDNLVRDMRKLDSAVGWEKTDGTGTFRLLDLRSMSLGFSLVFFPPTPEPLAAPVLSALLKNASSVSLTSDPLGAEVVTSRNSTVEEGRTVERVESFNVRESSLTRRKLDVKWR